MERPEVAASTVSLAGCFADGVKQDPEQFDELVALVRLEGFNDGEFIRGVVDECCVYRPQSGLGERHEHLAPIGGVLRSPDEAHAFRADRRGDSLFRGRMVCSRRANRPMIAMADTSTSGRSWFHCSTISST